MSTILEDYLTRDQLAAELNVCWRTVKRWTDRGEGPPVTRIGQTPYYRRTSVAEWLRSREVAA
jgi:hypothetical protein